ncbi:diguanylate cyclase [Microvirga sp. BT689]|uniref:GGDEF domain-containing protein n=1 Tax=Microvirga arvi TaxID=2778731 RepID=UPI00194E10D6|nr:sensor domain-containing diguanylate cyclase [Microvirga arvi]MBM6582193.1 diguanylate cyclase [Microvirga arvi]
MTSLPFTPDDGALRYLVETLTESGQAVSIFDADDNLRYANKTYQGMFLGNYNGPFTFTGIVRHAHRNGLGVRIDDGNVEAFLARTLPRRRSVPRKSFETDLVDGRWFWIDHTVLPNGWVLSVGADITTLKNNEKSLRQAHEAALKASQTDQLTGLPNRRHILGLLDEALAASETTGTGLCVAVIDIDHFKAINDAHGHEAGDAVLEHFAHSCRARVRAQDCLGRTGGEEFLLLLPEVRLDDAVRIIDRIRDGFPPAVLEHSRLELPCTFSAGVTEALPDDDRSSILRRADRALYAAKEEGRNRTRISSEGTP